MSGYTSKVPPFLFIKVCRRISSIKSRTIYYWIEDLYSIEVRNIYSPQEYCKDKRKSTSNTTVITSRSKIRINLKLGAVNIERDSCRNSIEDLSRTENKNKSRVGTYAVRDIYLRTQKVIRLETHQN